MLHTLVSINLYDNLYIIRYDLVLCSYVIETFKGCNLIDKFYLDKMYDVLEFVHNLLGDHISNYISENVDINN